MTRKVIVISLTLLSCENINSLTERPFVTDLGPVVQRVDNAIQRINQYAADNCYENVLRYPLESDLSSG